MSTFEQGVGVYSEWAGQIKGLGNRRVEVVYRDDHFDPATARTVCKELVEKEKVFLLIGGAGVDQIKSCAEYAASAGIPYFSPGVTEGPFRGMQNYFALSETYTQQNVQLGQLIKNQIKKKKVGIVLTDSPLLKETADSFKAEAAKNGLQVVYEGKLAKDAGKNQTDTQVSNLKGKGAEVVYALISPTVFAYLVASAKQQAFNPTFTGPGLSVGLNLVATASCPPPPFPDIRYLSPMVQTDVINQYDKDYNPAYREKNGNDGGRHRHPALGDRESHPADDGGRRRRPQPAVVDPDAGVGKADRDQRLRADDVRRRAALRREGDDASDDRLQSGPIPDDQGVRLTVLTGWQPSQSGLGVSVSPANSRRRSWPASWPGRRCSSSSWPRTCARPSSSDSSTARCTASSRSGPRPHLQVERHLQLRAGRVRHRRDLRPLAAPRAQRPLRDRRPRRAVRGDRARIVSRSATSSDRCTRRHASSCSSRPQAWRCCASGSSSGSADRCCARCRRRSAEPTGSSIFTVLVSDQRMLLVLVLVGFGVGARLLLQPDELRARAARCGAGTDGDRARRASRPSGWLPSRGVSPPCSAVSPASSTHRSPGRSGRAS